MTLKRRTFLRTAAAAAAAAPLAAPAVAQRSRVLKFVPTADLSSLDDDYPSPPPCCLPGDRATDYPSANNQQIVATHQFRPGSPAG